MSSLYTEQFIQDLLCHPDRIQLVLAKIGRLDWRFHAANDGTIADVINQEVNFTGGRIDTLATFNARTRLVLIEVKAGTAGPAAVEQLAAYLNDWEAIRKSLQLPALTRENIVGIVLAEDFAGIAELPAGIKLLQFKWQGSAWPFLPFEPQPIAAEFAKPRMRAPKQSRLNSVADHIHRFDRDQDLLREAYLRIARCFLNDGDERQQWVVQNPKGKHLAIHYKGVYVAHLWSDTNWFRLGYGRWTSTFDGPVNATNWSDLKAKIEADFAALLQGIDSELPAIPAGFNWADAIRCEHERCSMTRE